ncbi:MAG: 4-(cytidine 5'-diphospho)-2-C-methyl-D-erythritol kinase [Actinomycetota bacterium]
MIFEADYSRSEGAIRAISHFRCNLKRLYGVLHDSKSWRVTEFPRLTIAKENSKLVYSFSGLERATITLESWSSEFSEIEIVVEGTKDEVARNRQIQYWKKVITDLRHRLGSSDLFVASAPAKVNLFFAVGAFLKDGYHEVASLYQALALREQLSMELSGRNHVEFCGPYQSLAEESVPRDDSNLVFLAQKALSEFSVELANSKFDFLIKKSVPIAGGMAGGSADAAAALTLIDGRYGLELGSKLEEIGSSFGADVPFSIRGGTAQGLGRGEVLSPIETSGTLHFVVTPNPVGLATPLVYKQLDLMRIEEGIDVSALAPPTLSRSLLKAVADANPEALAPLMANDLERAALRLRPELRSVLEAGEEAGALRSMISGSGPSIVHLARNRTDAELIAERLRRASFESIVSYSSQSGSRLES